MLGTLRCPRPCLLCQAGPRVTWRARKSRSPSMEVGILAWILGTTARAGAAELSWLLWLLMASIAMASMPVSPTRPLQVEAA